MTTKPFPDYKNYPLDEVVCGLTFEPLQRFKMPHFGLFWSRLEKSFPRCEQAHPIGNINEIIEPGLGVPLPRVWLINSTDDQLIQIQRNTFLFNWRKRENPYPRFSYVYSNFSENLNIFKEFVEDYDLGGLIFKNYELSYVNLILQGEGWESLEKIHLLFPDISWRDKEDRFLKKIDSLAWQTTSKLPDNYGEIIIKVQKGVRRIDQRLLIRLDLTVRGFSDDVTQDGIKRWFEKAHKWIVFSFEDIIDEGIQREVWGKNANS